MSIMIPSKSYKNVLLVLARNNIQGTFCMTDLLMKNILANKYSIISIEHFKSSCSLVKYGEVQNMQNTFEDKFEQDVIYSPYDLLRVTDMVMLLLCLLLYLVPIILYQISYKKMNLNLCAKKLLQSRKQNLYSPLLDQIQSSVCYII